jgi:hypothetical protein
MSKKSIYEFTETKSEKQAVEKKRKNKSGEEETIISSKTVKVPVKFVIEKPTRRMADDAEVYYSVQLSKSIKMGIVTKAMLVKKYADNGGALSDEESKELLQSLKKLNEMENEFHLLRGVNDPKDKAKADKLEISINSLRRELVNLETSLQTVYQHTADAKAERETLLWYVINLSKIVNEFEETESFFTGNTFEEKLEDFYAKYEEEDGFYYESVIKLSKIVGYWFFSQDATKEDIDNFVKQDG